MAHASSVCEARYPKCERQARPPETPGSPTSQLSKHGALPQAPFCRPATAEHHRAPARNATTPHFEGKVREVGYRCSYQPSPILPPAGSAASAAAAAQEDFNVRAFSALCMYPNLVPLLDLLPAGLPLSSPGRLHGDPP